MADDVQEAAPEIAESQTGLGSKQCASDIPFNDVRWPERSGEVMQEPTQTTGKCWLGGPKENTQTNRQAMQ